LSIALGTLKPQNSPVMTSPTILPGYRDSIYGGSQQLVAWRDGQHEDTPTNHQHLPRISSVTDSHSGLPRNSPSDPRNLTGSQQHAHRTSQGQNHPPPLLTSESTNRSTSSASTVSSAFFTPRTPLEPPLERGLPIPSLYPQKSYENQLPPLRPSLSPQSSLVTTQQSPSSIHAVVDSQPSIAPLRGYGSSQPGQNNQPDRRYQEYLSNSVDDNNLDPVSALLRAGEIVDRGERSNGSRIGP